MADAIFNRMKEGVEVEAELLDHDRWRLFSTVDGYILEPIPETDDRPAWIIAVLEVGHKQTEIPIAGIAGEVIMHTVYQSSLTWVVWRPSHVLGLPFLPLQYKVWKHADEPVLVEPSDLETVGYVKTNFVDIALNFIPGDVRVQTVYEVGDLDQVIRWETERVRG